MNHLSYVFSLASALVVAASVLTCSPAMAIEEPEYRVVKTYDEFEVRRYAPFIVAQTTVAAGLEVAGNEAFNILAAYIFGKNEGARKIEMTAPVAQTPLKLAMTAPVSQTASGDGYMVQFTMPREWTMDTLPKPLDPRVTLREIPERSVAAIQYSGTWSERRYEEHRARLEAAARRAGLTWRGEPVWARYDSPWTLWFLRRNEVWLELTP